MVRIGSPIRYRYGNEKYIGIVKNITTNDFIAIQHSENIRVLTPINEVELLSSFAVGDRIKITMTSDILNLKNEMGELLEFTFQYSSDSWKVKLDKYETKLYFYEDQFVKEEVVETNLLIEETKEIRWQL
jgi:hypothetical protein